MDYKRPGSMGGPGAQYFLGMEAGDVFKGSGDPKYPGGPFFNMLNLGSDASKMAELKAKEVNNGRLAMVAMAGFGMQACVTQKGPVQDFLDVFCTKQYAPTVLDGSAGDHLGLLTLAATALTGMVWLFTDNEAKVGGAAAGPMKTEAAADGAAAACEGTEAPPAAAVAATPAASPAGDVAEAASKTPQPEVVTVNPAASK
eukprot:351002-Chlamydomonas_euryale.AAC.21